MVSVIILTKNRSTLLARALQSISLQSYQDLEVIVVNDGSTDDTEGLLASSVMPLVVISHKNSIGITKSRQEALEKAAGEFVAFLDDDDTWIDSEKLSVQVAWLSAYRERVLIGTGMQVVAEGREPVSVFRPESDWMIRATFLLRNNFLTSSVMARTEALKSAGGFVYDGVDLAEDYDAWLRLGRLGIMHNIPQVMVAYRMSSLDQQKRLLFFLKQQALIARYRASYPYYWFSRLVISARIAYTRVRKN